MNTRPCMCLISALMTTTGILMVGGGIWIVVDQNEMGELTDSIQDSFSLCRLSRCWSNFGFVSTGMGLATLLVVLFGVCGFPKKDYVCLFLLYITLITTIIILQIFAIIIIERRNKEMKDILHKDFSDPKLFFFVYSSSISLATLILAISLVLATFHKKSEVFGQLITLEYEQ